MNKGVPLDAWGWTSFFSQQHEEIDRSTIPARVITTSRSSVSIIANDAVHSIPLRAAPKLKRMPAVGDWLLCQPSSLEPTHQLIRKNVLRRRRSGSDHRAQDMLANFEQIMLITSANRDFNESRLERGLVLVEQSGVKALVLLTKVDLATDLQEFRERLEAIPSMPPVIELDAREPASAQALAGYLHFGETTALVGSSGVGKSTLVNSLLGSTRQSTQAIREQDARGRHTTTQRELIALPSGAIIVDNPGVRELGVLNASNAVASVFEDIESLARACRFSDCEHQSEPDCKVQISLQAGELSRRRFDNYLKLRQEARSVSTY
ncbi:MAG: ribosome small subunit-dependent GTPase A [Gammaproteobacteria bacterium]|nr:ribosome small subunit-dependent GTPase A [Gammaproteobacteria bacterium]